MRRSITIALAALAVLAGCGGGTSASASRSTTTTFALSTTPPTYQPYIPPAPSTAAHPVASRNCPRGDYLNSRGDDICNPYPSATQPTGATAQCVDGWWSFSESRSGTCSGHGGVGRWL